MTTGQRRSSIRERVREQVREDAKAVALRQLSEGGAQAISLNAIAKQIGCSGPALYRYYASRDELLNTLVIDAYHDLRDALARDAAASPHPGRPRERLHGLAHAYRRWAGEQPHRYELLFKPPFPGYEAHAEPISRAAGSLMDVVLGILDGREPSRGDHEEPPARGATANELRGFAVRMWSRLHGFVSLELGGAWAATRVDADALFDAEVRALDRDRAQ